MPTDVSNMLLWYLALHHLLQVHHRMSTKILHAFLLTKFAARGGGDDPHRQCYVPLLVN